MGAVWVTGDVITAARMNQKTVLVDTGTNLNSATKYAGMLLFCTSTGSGYTKDILYEVASDGSTVNSIIASTDSVVYVLDSTIGDYTTPTTAVASSFATGTAIALDVTSFKTQGAGSTITTASFTIAANSNRILIANVTHGNASDPGISSVKLDGTTSMTLVPNSAVYGNSLKSALYYLINPASGSHTITATFGGSVTSSGLGFWSIYNVDQTTGVQSGNATTAASNPGVTCTPTLVGSWIVAGFCIASSAGGSNSDTVDWHDTVNSVLTGEHKASPTINSANTITSTGSTAMSASACEVMAANPDRSALSVVDSVTTTRWQSLSEVGPNVYVDMNSAQILSGIAIYWDSADTTATQIKISTSTDHVSWTDKRLMNVSELTNGAWNFIRWDLSTVQERYVRILATDAGAVVLAIWEIKVLAPTQLQVTMRHAHKSISATTAGLGTGA